MKAVARALHLANVVLFIGIAWIGFQRYQTGQNQPVQLIALAVAVVGPVEDFLKNRVRRGKPSPEEPAVGVVDKATSAIFLALLLWVMLMLS